MKRADWPSAGGGEQLRGCRLGWEGAEPLWVGTGFLFRNETMVLGAQRCGG